jgi:N-acetylneuraminate synthase
MEHLIEINGRRVGKGEPVYIIAELSANHDKKLAQAMELLEAAKTAGADAVKIQTYTPDTITIPSEAPPFQIDAGTLWQGRNLYELYSEAFTPWEWHTPLRDAAHDMGLDFFSTAFDPTAVDYLEEMKVPVHKIASFELVDIPLIEKMARTGKPLIMSTGMATLEEITDAVDAARGAGATQIALLRCNSAYPAPAREMNLRSIPHMSQTFNVAIGLSDHTLGAAVPVAAVALGACIIEKHLTLSRQQPGPDAAFSLEPGEFKEMVESVRMAQSALGKVGYGPGPEETKSVIFRRSLFIVQDVRAGEILTEENVRSIRPAHGLPPKFLAQVLGKRAVNNLETGTPLRLEDVEP